MKNKLLLWWNTEGMEARHETEGRRHPILLLDMLLGLRCLSLLVVLLPPLCLAKLPETLPPLPYYYNDDKRNGISGKLPRVCPLLLLAPGLTQDPRHEGPGLQV